MVMALDGKAPCAINPGEASPASVATVVVAASATSLRRARQWEMLMSLSPVLFLVMGRSEEHTSELQSHLNLVCRLLLEKKKNRTTVSRSRSAVPHPTHGSRVPPAPN